MKCLVTGATGFIGGALARHLASRGMSVESTGREPPADAQFEGAQVVFHCAGIAHRAASESDYEAYNFRASLVLAERAAAAGVRRFIFLSSVNAADPGDPYGYWKSRTEQALADAHDGSNMRVVSVRPALVYGAGARANLQRLISLVRRGMPRPPEGQARSMIGLPDLCEALYLLTEVDSGHGRVFCATDGESYTPARMHAAISRGLGREPGPSRLPEWAWRVACAVFDTVRGEPRGGKTYGRLFLGTEYSNRELCEVLAWQPRDRFEDLVPDMLAAESEA